MALTTDGLTHWNVVDPTTLASSDNDNAGCFWVGGSGTDKTNGAPTIFTDLVVDAITNTNVTSAAFPFGASDVGNYINITSGVGWTTGRYRVVSVAGVIATLDASPAAVTVTGGNGRLGGALPSPGQAGAAILTTVNQRIWLRGTHLKTTNTSNVAGGFLTLSESSIIQGYTTTRGDAGNPTSSMLPVINSNSFAGTVVITQGNSSKIIGIRFELNTGYRVGGSSSALNAFDRCYVNGGGIALNAAETFTNCVVVVNNAANALDSRDAKYIRCTFLMSAIRFVGTGVWEECTFIRSDAGEIFANTTSDRTLAVKNCTFVTANGYPVDLTISANREVFLFDRCLFYAVSAQACVRTSDGSPGRMIECAYNTAPSNSGSYPIANYGGVLLGADPFTNRAGGDYSLTDVAKAALRIDGTSVLGLPNTETLAWIGALPIGPVSTAGGGDNAVTVTSETREVAATSAAYELLAQDGDVIELQVASGASGSNTKAMIYFKATQPATSATGYVIESEVQGKLVYTLSGVDLWGRAFGSDVRFVLNGTMASLD